MFQIPVMRAGQTVLDLSPSSGDRVQPVLRGSTRDLKQDGNSIATESERIFVQIASYRDPECQWTLKDMFEKAANPNRIFAGVVWQYVPEEDDYCFELTFPPRQVRTKMIHAKHSKGVCWARSKTQKLWSGEEFTLQIDSHMRFEQDWDAKLIRMCKQVQSPKPVLTCYPAGYSPPNKKKTGYVFSMGARKFKRDGVLTMEGRAIPVKQAPATPIPGVFCSACFLFAPSAIITEVPYDPLLYFFGEEITLAVRLWTHGWDIFYPNEPILYHDWKRKRRRTHFDDHHNWDELDSLSVRRVRHLLGIEQSSDAAVVEGIENYGLGDQRSLEEYQRYSGVNFLKRHLSSQAKQGAPYPPFAKNGKHKQKFRIMTKALDTHKPHKVFECPGGVVYDDFLPEDLYRKVYHYACATDYERINTRGRVKKVWRIRDGFPLRSLLNLFYFADEARRPKPKPDWVYPSNTALDGFAEHLNQLAPKAAPYIGRAKKDWDRFSATAWIYPRDTALSLHDDGSGIYSGAFTYFLNPHWDIHWGGLLLFIDPRACQALQDYKTPENVVDYYDRKWIEPVENSFIWEPGLAQCIFPKRNRIVFIHPEAYHLVTKVYNDAGDNNRMSLAGFFQKPKKK